MRDGWVTGGKIRPAGERDAEPATVRARYVRRGRRRGQPVREARRRPARRHEAARDRGPPVLPGHLSPRAVVRVVAGPVGGRPAAARLRVAVPGRRRAHQPRRRSAQHVQGVQGHLRAAAVQRVRDDAARPSGASRGDGGGARPVGPAADEPQPACRRPSGHAAGRRRRRAVNPFNGEGIAYAMETGEIAAELIARLAREGPARHRADATRRCCGSGTGGTSRSDVVRAGDRQARRSWAPPRSTCCRTRTVMNVRDAPDGEPHRRPRGRRAATS